MQKDPIEQAEKVVKEMHDMSGKYMQPTLRRYPLIFSFLIIFSMAAILHGFELVSDQIELFDRHPTYLILIGVFTLFCTGMLYKAIERMK